MKIAIPSIYEENILEFIQRRGDIVFKYLDVDRLFQITFHNVYAFDFVEFDYIQELNWQFGLELLENTSYIQQMIHLKPKETFPLAFGGETKKMRHYRLVVDDVGIYNVICKDIDMCYI